MKIGIVCYPTYGGSGVIATELGLGLARNGHEVHFITYKKPARLTGFHANVYYHEVDTQSYPLFEFTPYETALASKLTYVIKYEKLDILHVHYAIPHASVAYLAKQILKKEGINIPFITTLHGTDITLVGNDSTYSPLVTFGINESDAVTSVSESLKKATQISFDITNPIEVIPNFIDFARFQRKNKDHFRKFIAPTNEKIIIHTSNFRKVKRVEDVLYIFGLISEKIPSKLLMVGDGPDRARCEEICRENHLCDNVTFLGKQDAVEELLAVSDLFLMPSEQESFGLAALEAMACRVPVVSSNAGGLPEVNEQGVTGYLCEIGDIVNMAQRSIEILSDEEKLLEFSNNAYRKAREFDLVKILPMYENLYHRVLMNQ
ncbi:MAG: N-acetyl-alpha-D-glucosaminyl L-malate synthase BshA [Saprospiraceae bacterium]|nr:N-acetyl-alpha-D-glucosaminyl L-malate synthase BshA [Saprospiraceae bacterium]